jgi:7-cyano-7-deazaguanine synthase in queuosine biosynthesis
MSTAGRLTDALTGRALALDIGRNVSVNLTPFKKLGAVDSLDEDLLRLASYVYVTDLAIKRHEREQHLRSITLSVPVVNIHAFRQVHAVIEQALTTLSRDNWTLQFSPITTGQPAANRSWPAKENSTLMFSGGLDSFAGSIQILQKDAELTLVSHATHNQPVKNAQSVLADSVKTLTKKNVQHLQINVFGRNSGGLTFPRDDEREDTQRLRFFLFASLAAVAASLNGSRRIVVMAENGQFAIHLPLSEARIGSFSTHTAHPKFLLEMQEILRRLYACDDLEVVNPFVHSTKAEVVAIIPKLLQSQIPNSTSCWRASRVATSHSHCGVCIPCLCRRIALETNGIKLDEYERDLFGEDIASLDPDDLGKRNLVDLCEFVSKFEGSNKIASEEDLRFAFPDLLFDDTLAVPEILKMYRRFASEALTVFKNYPRVVALF